MCRKTIHDSLQHLHSFASMKIIIEEGMYSYQVDYAKDPERDEDDIPPVEECIESFLRLLENIHPKEEIAAYIEEGIQYSGMHIMQK